MDGGLADSIRLAAQWLFGPLLAIVALAWLCVRLEASGAFDVICSAVRKMPAGRRFAFFALAAVFIAFAGTKTNSPPMNLPGPILPPSILVPVLSGLSPSSCGIPVPLPAEPFAAPSDGATTNVRWLVRGACEDAVRIPFPGEDGFPWRGGVATALTAFACGEFRPNASTEYFPAPFGDPVSLPPLGRQDANAPSVFWHAATPSNSLITTWENALYGRDAACPTNFQAEFFADGSFIYRYPDHATAYPPVLPFDYDGDGLENSVDPDPEVPGPDAHGTNAQWYNTVCSNILVATEATNCVPPVSLAWKVGVNSNAYYFVDVVAERGPAPIRFMDANGAMPDDPVVVARAGEVCRVPLVVGVEYAVTSAVPFTVSHAYGCEIGRPPDYTLKIEPRDGGGTTVHWPIRFSYVEKNGSTTEFTLSSSPSGLELVYNWHVTGGNGQQHAPSMMMLPLMPMAVPLPPGLLGSPDGYECFTCEGSNVVVSCSGDCGCGGCTLGGTASHVGHSVDLPYFTCGCSPPPDDPDPEDPPDSSVPSIDVSFNAPAVIYEAAYVNAPGETVAKRSTLVTVTLSVSGGPHGGVYSVLMSNLGRLVPVSGEVPIPILGSLGAYETLNASCTYEGASPSGSKGDVTISGFFVDTETGSRVNCNESKMTVIRVELSPYTHAIDNNLPNRHLFGVNELVQYAHEPSSLNVTWDMSRGGSLFVDDEYVYYRCPLYVMQNPLVVGYDSVVYEPQISILAPTGIVARNPSVTKYINVPDGHAGGLGLVQEFHVKPGEVSFSRIAVEEVPCDSSQPTGYFGSPSISTVLVARSHTTAAGAGRWFDVDRLGRVGGATQMVDTAAIETELPPMLPNGTLSPYVADGWLNGSMTWDNPFGWTGLGPSAGASPVGVFATGVKDIYSITVDGDVSVFKLGNTALRTVDGNCFLNGSQVTPEEVYYVPSSNGNP
jgi:hypothetical protein